MTAPWEQLRKRGDWLIVEDKRPSEVSSLVAHWLRRQYSPQCIYSCKEVPEGTIVFLAYVPHGAVEAYDARQEELRDKKIETINTLRETGQLRPHSSAPKNVPNPNRSGTYGDDTSDPMAELDEEYGDDD